MCGIALILSHETVEERTPLMEDIKSALYRRGPDSLGLSRVSVSSQEGGKQNNEENSLELCLIGAELQLRGENAISQPLISPCGNILVFNGEIFGGINVLPHQNDAESLLKELEKTCLCNYDENHTNKTFNYSKNEVKSVPEIFSSIRGPWSFIYWEKRTKTVYFGRDAFGRRSFLVHWPNSHDPNFILSSVSPPNFGTENYWDELSCGIYSLNLNDTFLNEMLFNKVIKYDWTDPQLINLINWARKYSDPKLELSLNENTHEMPQKNLACKVLDVLKQSVMKRTIVSSVFQREGTGEENADVALLFSGGLDSMILAALLHQCIDIKYTIDLINVSFDGELAPDRISAKSGLKELQKIAPFRKWRLIEVDSSLSELNSETQHVKSLIHPSKTYMDLNIGIALYLAAGGDGWVDGNLCNNLKNEGQKYKYESKSKVVLIGSGADEQCAGYGRHRTKFRLEGWSGLNEEMRIDMQRIWKRNLGRDDRCVSDHGKEARFPFLDEDVIQTLLDLPLWEIANLNEPIGTGDKKILRQVAMLLGLHEAAKMPKRAIQFGSRIAQESNKKNFGSNRAANQKSAGSVNIGSSE
ncbi:hypothetical protein LUZ60_004914 [Juncus effusus]|nr:hypothetical protein LUZ60_004914 [Juncus effusus]